MNTRLGAFRAIAVGPTGGLGELTKSQAGGIAASGALRVAAMVDPEPISKAALAIAAGFASLVATAFAGCGQTCVQATQIVNSIEPYLQKNKDAYLALATPRPLSVQQAAIAVFDDAWARVVNACSDPNLGDAGKRCISDRAPGGKYPWAQYYRDPIANDTNVYDDSLVGQASSVASGLTSQVSSLFGGNETGLLIAGGIAAALGLFLMSGGKK